MQTQLLTRAELRAIYREDPQAALREVGLPETAVCPGLDIDELDAQAQILIGKRWHEVQKLLRLPSEQDGYHAQFQSYAESHWPEGHRRHQRDALAFAAYVKRTRGSNLGDWRVNLLRFCEAKRSFALHWVRALPVKSRWRTGVQIIYRRAEGPAQLFFYLAM